MQWSLLAKKRKTQAVFVAILREGLSILRQTCGRNLLHATAAHSRKNMKYPANDYVASLCFRSSLSRGKPDNLRNPRRKLYRQIRAVHLKRRPLAVEFAIVMDFAPTQRDVLLRRDVVP